MKKLIIIPMLVISAFMALIVTSTFHLQGITAFANGAIWGLGAILVYRRFID